MKRLKCDLHIHSALSPCACDDMTPANIINMCKLKNLDVIAVTDHQSCENLKSLEFWAAKSEILLIPAMEIETAESVHMICLLPSTERAIEFGNIIKESLPNIANRTEVFGNQLLFSVDDKISGTINHMLMISSSITFIDLLKIVEDYDGIAYPAHVDRESNGIISVFGEIPPEYTGRLLELSTKCDISDFLDSHPELKDYRFIRSSDSHSLSDIPEDGDIVEVAQEETSKTDISAFFRALRA